MIAAVINLHSTFSRGKFSIPQLVDGYGALGVGAIAITDTLKDTRSLSGRAAMILHKSLRPAVFPIYREILRSEARRAWEKYRMVLIPGVEIVRPADAVELSSRFLALGVSDLTDLSENLEDAADWVKARGGIVYPTPAQRTKPLKLSLDCEKDVQSILAALEKEGDRYASTTGNGLGSTGNIRHPGPPRGNVALPQALSSTYFEAASTTRAPASGFHFETPQRR
jgi:hypothetical protein